MFPFRSQKGKKATDNYGFVFWPRIIKIESNKPADNEWELNILTPVPGMHNTRTAGQMRPSKAVVLNLFKVWK